jgi:hypothetical protein
MEDVMTSKNIKILKLKEANLIQRIKMRVEKRNRIAKELSLIEGELADLRGEQRHVNTRIWLLENEVTICKPARGPRKANNEKTEKKKPAVPDVTSEEFIESLTPQQALDLVAKLKVGPFKKES